jgi:hypothetical protein
MCFLLIIHFLANVIYRSGGYGSTAYVTFKEPYALETAVLLSVSFIGSNISKTSSPGHFSLRRI